jgi:hypothetical protein
VAKSSSKDRDRRAVVEEMRRKQQAQERRRTLIVITACVAVGAVIIGFALVQYLQNRADENRDLSDIGVASAAASCQPVKTRPYDGPAKNHVENGTPLTYQDAPPAFGQHWAIPIQSNEYRSFYTAEDRPAKELLVHSQEHGYTILWYDQSIADDPQQLDDLKAIGNRLPDPPNDRLVIAPWTSEDGDAFPGGSHVALTHWTGPDDQKGVWQYCGQVSGDVVGTFLDDYPASDAPEPGSM